MTKQWQELKETIVEMRDSEGTCTQQEVCKFLVDYMDILEKQNNAPKAKDIVVIAKQGATNGDMIMVVFPSSNLMFDKGGFIGLQPIGEHWTTLFTESWWNAPYKLEGEE